jgi:hypothetical protein
VETGGIARLDRPKRIEIGQISGGREGSESVGFDRDEPAKALCRHPTQNGRVEQAHLIGV